VDRPPSKLPSIPATPPPQPPSLPPSRLPQLQPRPRRYVGLTDDPERRRQEHGNPADWKQLTFDSEAAARLWEETLLNGGYRGGTGGAGWRYGYTYTITPTTRQ
jgi:hypothetical protein